MKDRKGFYGKGEAREVVLLGPSAPLYPEPFFKRGITAVMGTRITVPATMLTVVSEAGGTKKAAQMLRGEDRF